MIEFTKADLQLSLDASLRDVFDPAEPAKASQVILALPWPLEPLSIEHGRCLHF